MIFVGCLEREATLGQPQREATREQPSREATQEQPHVCFVWSGCWYQQRVATQELLGGGKFGCVHNGQWPVHKMHLSGDRAARTRGKDADGAGRTPMFRLLLVLLFCFGGNVGVGGVATPAFLLDDTILADSSTGLPYATGAGTRTSSRIKVPSTPYGGASAGDAYMTMTWGFGGEVVLGHTSGHKASTVNAATPPQARRRH